MYCYAPTLCLMNLILEYDSSWCQQCESKTWTCQVHRWPAICICCSYFIIDLCSFLSMIKWRRYIISWIRSGIGISCADIKVNVLKHMDRPVLPAVGQWNTKNLIIELALNPSSTLSITTDYTFRVSTVRCFLPWFLPKGSLSRSRF